MSRQIGVKARNCPKSYTLQHLEEAAELVQSKSISLSSAARVYSIPKTKLHDNIRGKYVSNKSGCKTVLTAQWVINIHMEKVKEHFKPYF